MKKVISIIILTLLAAFVVAAQTDTTAYKTDHRREVKSVRAGNKAFKKGDFRKSEVDYRKSLLYDSLSVAGNYNLAETLYRQDDSEGAVKAMEPVQNVVKGTEHEAAYNYNLGDYYLETKNYGAAVEAFKQALLLSPGDRQTRENYQYAKKMLENQQNQQDQNQQNQDQNQNDQNQDQNQDQQNQDQNKDQNKDQQDQNQDQNQQQQQQVSQQAAEAMLQAINEQEKKTKEEVDKKKAQAMKDAQKKKNW